MQLVLVGQPYCGKSTIFNEVVGYKAVTTNAPGAREPSRAPWKRPSGPRN